MTDADSIFAGLAERLRARGGQVAVADGSFQFLLTGEGGGEYHLTVKDRQATIAPGQVTAPTVTVTMNAADLEALLKGELNAVAAFFGGRIKISGDLGRAMELQSILSPGARS